MMNAAISTYIGISHGFLCFRKGHFCCCDLIATW
jgi:hypothetical protein